MKIKIRKRIKRMIRIKSRRLQGVCCDYDRTGPNPSLHLAPNPVPTPNLSPDLSLLFVYQSIEDSRDTKSKMLAA